MEPSSGLVSGIQVGLGAVMIAVPLLLLALRWWTAAVLMLSFHAFVLAHAVINVGDEPRYFYFPAAVLALGLGAFVAELILVKRPTYSVGRSTAVVMAAIALVSTLAGYINVQAWDDAAPAQYEAFIDQAEELGDLPSGATVFVTNLPLSLALYDGFYLNELADSVWPGAGVNMRMIGLDDVDGQQAALTGGDAIFVYAPDTGLCGERRRGRRTEATALFRTLEIDQVPGDRAEVELARFGPFEDQWAHVVWETDGAGRARLQLDIPWFPREPLAWQPIEAGATRFAIVANPIYPVFDVFVDGVGSLTIDTVGFTPEGDEFPVRIERVPDIELPTGISLTEPLGSICKPLG